MPKKLIEVAIPLADINAACTAEKNIRTGFPANLHLWWARRPLAASRAVLFAQLVDDPSEHPDQFPDSESVERERERLFSIIRGLVKPTGPSVEVLNLAHAEIRKNVGDDVTVIDPFAGGGSIPIEAQRLHLNVEASDLNPVAVLLNSVLLNDVKIALDRASVHPTSGLLPTSSNGSGLSGLSEDLLFYGERLRELVAGRVGENYPGVIDERGNELPVISWIWARTTPCPNPACGIDAPLVRSFVICKKSGREKWVDPITSGPGAQVRFEVRDGKSPRISGTVGRSGATCVACQSAIPLASVRQSGRDGQMKFVLMAVVGLGDRRRIYSSPTEAHVQAADVAATDPLGTDMPAQALGFRVQAYGMTRHADLFTARQLSTLHEFCSLLDQVRAEVEVESDEEYANLIALLLSICVSNLTKLSNNLVTWGPSVECPFGLFSRQAVPMVWDFAEGNPLGGSSGSFMTIVENVARTLRGALVEYSRPGRSAVVQENAASRIYPEGCVVCTDPPYFDNIGYADLSDFFYVWLRLMLRDLKPGLFDSVLSPKSEELVATPFRFGGSRDDANQHFESGFRHVFSRIKERHRPDTPLTVFYAYKQEDEESGEDSGSSGAGATGWEKLLQGLVDAGLQITATWPMRTERSARMVGRGTNALASSVVLVCRPRSDDAGLTDVQGFRRHLRRELAQKLHELQSGGVQPVDMAQASIGPGMAVFTSYGKVLESGDTVMSVGTALQIINQVLDELQTDQESEFDVDTRWAVTWFEQNGMNPGDFGDALNIATARGTAMNALERSGIIEARAGRVRLLSRGDLSDDWDPKTDKRLTVWEVCQHLIRRIEGDGGLMAAASVLQQVGGLGEAARELAYRLYEIANRKGWSEEARAYNNLAAEWPDLVALASQSPSDPSTLF